MGERLPDSTPLPLTTISTVYPIALSAAGGGWLASTATRADTAPPSSSSPAAPSRLPSLLARRTAPRRPLTTAALDTLKPADTTIHPTPHPRPLPHRRRRAPSRLLT
ncbi:hypothetical protein K525DRAFT_281503 [Schizophyllum commune Loenen D]|nr:hypothetical protein K525DRAFT_281503 [Schizophyllum commune Loenen D]